MNRDPAASRMGRLAGESAFRVLAAAQRLEAQGRSIVHFEIGEPDFPTAPHIVAAAKRALDEGRTRYCPAQGLPELREAIAEHCLEYRRLPTRPERVVVASGAKPILFAALCALVEEGEEVIYPDPGFPTYESVIRFTGGLPVPVSLREEAGFQMRAADIAVLLSPRTKLLILNSPSNPTGGIFEQAELAALAAALAGREVYVLSDEIYSRIVYEGSARSIACLPGMAERTIVVDGFSKTYAMTGWRLGYGIMREDIAEKVTRLLINSSSCTPPFVQLAGLEALRGPQGSVQAMVREYRRRRDLMATGLNSIPGLTCRTPRGAFYAFPSIAGTGLPSDRAAELLLQEAGVAVLDGAAFGGAGAGFLRLSYAASPQAIQAGLERMRGFFKSL